MRFKEYQVREALHEACALLSGPVRPAAEIVEVLKPFYNCTGIEGTRSQRQEEKMRSQIFALTADAYRREESLHEAAMLYRHASSISPGNHVPFYAHLVCKHGLSDFYGDALKVLQEYRRRWLAKPRVVRLLQRLFAWSRMRKEDGEVSRTEDRNYQFLTRMARGNPALQMGVVLR